MSDEEIAVLGDAEIEKEDVKWIQEAWQEEDKEALVSYIVEPKQWKDFKVNQARIFQEVSSSSQHR